MCACVVCVWKRKTQDQQHLPFRDSPGCYGFSIKLHVISFKCTCGQHHTPKHIEMQANIHIHACAHTHTHMYIHTQIIKYVERNTHIFLVNLHVRMHRDTYVHKRQLMFNACAAKLYGTMQPPQWLVRQVMGKTWLSCSCLTSNGPSAHNRTTETIGTCREWWRKAYHAELRIECPMGPVVTHNSACCCHFLYSGETEDGIAYPKPTLIGTHFQHSKVRLTTTYH